MEITLWGSRGSIATSGPETQRYGGNTSCVEVVSNDGDRLILDAGTGIRKLGQRLKEQECLRVDLLLTHLHMDHIFGLGFFQPLFDKNVEAHIYGPADNEGDLETRLSRYLSPPLFPLSLHDLPCKLFLHPLKRETLQINTFAVSCDFVNHPGDTLGYRISAKEGSIAYISDHELAPEFVKYSTDIKKFPAYHIAKNVDLLLHDCQYNNEDYPIHQGWGHSTLEQALEFATLCGVKNLVTFHHEPGYDDKTIDKLIKETIKKIKPNFNVWPGCEGKKFTIPHLDRRVGR